MTIAFNSVIYAENFLSVSFIAYWPEVGINKPLGQKSDSARKHFCSFALSKMVLILHLYRMKSHLYNLFIKLVTGFWGHA